MKQSQKNTPLSKKMGYKIERVGQKISNSGAPKIGSFVSRVGDRLEHSGDDKSDIHDEKIKKHSK